ncbi:phospholipid carrier-dependent glycosyltransferase [[Eubacterium] cellulosolvens]
MKHIQWLRARFLTSKFQVTILSFFRRNSTFIISLAFFLCALIFRSWNFNNPTGFMVDEVYYAPAANSLLNLEPDPNYVHPPLGKLIIGIGIAFFGYNSFGWRIAAVIAGSLMVPSLYLFGKKVFDNPTAIMASTLLIFDSMAHVMSRIAMLDVFLALFVVLAFLTLAYSKYYLSAIALGLACSVKLSGAFAVIAVIAYLIYSKKIHEISKIIPIATVVFMLCILPTIIPDPESFVRTFFFSFNWHLTLDSPHSSSSLPFGWLINHIPFPIYSDAGEKISAIANPFIYPIAVPASIYLIYDCIRKKNCEYELLPVFWFVFVYGLFLILPRKTQFIFYLLPAIPAILLLFSYGILLVLDEISK